MSSAFGTAKGESSTAEGFGRERNSFPSEPWHL